jgi:hypothetical protein
MERAGSGKLTREVAGEEGQRWGFLLEEEWSGVAAFGDVHDGTGRQDPGERLNAREEGVVMA